MTKDRQLFRKILWFDKRLKFDIDFFDSLQAQRIVSEHPRYKSGTFYSEKCQREIQYESGIELEFIKLLEQSDKVSFYWEQPVQIKYRRGRRNAIYTPDFGIYLKSKEFVLVEIKGLANMCEHKVQMRIEALIKFCACKGFGLLLTDGKYTFDKLLKTKINRKLERRILANVENDILRKTACNEILKGCDATQNELLKVILKHNLKYRSYPFKLQKGNKNELFRQVFIDKRKYEDVVAERFAALFDR